MSVEPPMLLIASSPNADPPGETRNPIRPSPSEKPKEKCTLAVDVEARIYDVPREKALRRFYRYSLFALTDARTATIGSLALRSTLMPLFRQRHLEVSYVPDRVRRRSRCSSDGVRYFDE